MTTPDFTIETDPTVPLADQPQDTGDLAAVPADQQLDEDEPEPNDDADDQLADVTEPIPPVEDGTP